MLNNVECTANVALAGSWVVPRYRCPLDQLRLHSFALPSPDLFQTCDFDCHSLVDLQIDLRLRLIGLAKWRPRATTCSKESKSKITSACAMIRFDSAVSTHQGVITPVLVCVVWLVWVVSVSVCKWIHSGYYSKAIPYTFHAAQAPFFLALHHPGDRIVRS